VLRLLSEFRDKVLRYENLDDEILSVLPRLSPDTNRNLLDIPKLKVSDSNFDASEILSKDNKLKAQQLFAPVFELMGYEK
tara:strand:- start:105 stop:344 length:240 start_codon:yes stop_codon:yes gene_type:complete